MAALADGQWDSAWGRCSRAAGGPLDPAYFIDAVNTLAQGRLVPVPPGGAFLNSRTAPRGSAARRGQRRHLRQWTRSAQRRLEAGGVEGQSGVEIRYNVVTAERRKPTTRHSELNLLFPALQTNGLMGGQHQCRGPPAQMVGHSRAELARPATREFPCARLEGAPGCRGSVTKNIDAHAEIGVPGYDGHQACFGMGIVNHVEIDPAEGRQSKVSRTSLFILDMARPFLPQLVVCGLRFGAGICEAEHNLPFAGGEDEIAPLAARPAPVSWSCVWFGSKNQIFEGAWFGEKRARGASR